MSISDQVNCITQTEHFRPCYNSDWTYLRPYYLPLRLDVSDHATTHTEHLRPYHLPLRPDVSDHATTHTEHLRPCYHSDWMSHTMPPLTLTISDHVTTHTEHPKSWHHLHWTSQTIILPKLWCIRHWHNFRLQYSKLQYIIGPASRCSSKKYPS